MATVSENLTALQGAKSAIKQAITDKGVSMDGVPFVQYAEKIGEIPTGVAGGISPDNKCLAAMRMTGYYDTATEGIMVDVPGSDVAAVFPEGKIYGLAMRQRYVLRSIEIPSSISEIWQGAFSGCANLERVILRSGVTVVHYNTFQSCTKLKTLALFGETRVTSANAIPTTIEHIVLPSSKWEYYCGATNWVNFADMFEVRHGITNLIHNEDATEGTFEIGAEITYDASRTYDFVSQEKIFFSDDFSVNGYLYANGVTEGCNYSYTTPDGSEGFIAFIPNPDKATT